MGKTNTLLDRGYPNLIKNFISLPSAAFLFDFNLFPALSYRSSGKNSRSLFVSTQRYKQQKTPPGTLNKVGRWVQRRPKKSESKTKKRLGGQIRANKKLFFFRYWKKLIIPWTFFLYNICTRNKVDFLLDELLFLKCVRTIYNRIAGACFFLYIQAVGK